MQYFGASQQVMLSPEAAMKVYGIQNIFILKTDSICMIDVGVHFEKHSPK